MYKTTLYVLKYTHTYALQLTDGTATMSVLLTRPVLQGIMGMSFQQYGQMSKKQHKVFKLQISEALTRTEGVFVVNPGGGGGARCGGSSTEEGGVGSAVGDSPGALAASHLWQVCVSCVCVLLCCFPAASRLWQVCVSMSPSLSLSQPLTLCVYC